jgi:hypothetical protein
LAAQLLSMIAAQIVALPPDPRQSPAGGFGFSGPTFHGRDFERT